MRIVDLDYALVKLTCQAGKSIDSDSQVRIHIGNQLYDVDHIDTVIDMDPPNKTNIVIHVKEN